MAPNESKNNKQEFRRTTLEAKGKFGVEIIFENRHIFSCAMSRTQDELTKRQNNLSYLFLFKNLNILKYSNLYLAIIQI
jgi:hypothetical protein